MAARRGKSTKEKFINGMIRAASCVILLTFVLIAMQMFAGYVKTNLYAGEDAEVMKAQTPPEAEPDTEPDAEETGIFTVCVDAGHGGKDVGSDYKNRYEKDDNLALALALQSYLKEQNVKVVMTREDDTFLKLSARCNISNDAKADYFVSLHRNKGDGYGVESWLYSNANAESVSLAENIMKGMEAAGISRNRGISHGTSEGADSDYYVNSHSNAPSLILEVGFMNSSKDNELLDQNKESYAKAIGDAILQTYETYHKKTDAGGSNESKTDSGQQSTQQE